MQTPSVSFLSSPDTSLKDSFLAYKRKNNPDNISTKEPAPVFKKPTHIFEHDSPGVAQLRRSVLLKAITQPRSSIISSTPIHSAGRALLTKERICISPVIRGRRSTNYSIKSITNQLESTARIKRQKLSLKTNMKKKNILSNKIRSPAIVKKILSNLMEKNTQTTESLLKKINSPIDKENDDIPNKTDELKIMSLRGGTPRKQLKSITNAESSVQEIKEDIEVNELLTDLDEFVSVITISSSSEMASTPRNSIITAPTKIVELPKQPTQKVQPKVPESPEEPQIALHESRGTQMSFSGPNAKNKSSSKKNTSRKCKNVSIGTQMSLHNNSSIRDAKELTQNEEVPKNNSINTQTSHDNKKAQSKEIEQTEITTQITNSLEESGHKGKRTNVKNQSTSKQNTPRKYNISVGTQMSLRDQSSIRDAKELTNNEEVPKSKSANIQTSSENKKARTEITTQTTKPHDEAVPKGKRNNVKNNSMQINAVQTSRISNEQSKPTTKQTKTKNVDRSVSLHQEIGYEQNGFEDFHFSNDESVPAQTKGDRRPTQSAKNRTKQIHRVNNENQMKMSDCFGNMSSINQTGVMTRSRSRCMNGTSFMSNGLADSIVPTNKSRKTTNISNVPMSKYILDGVTGFVKIQEGDTSQSSNDSGAGLRPKRKRKSRKAFVQTTLYASSRESLMNILGTAPSRKSRAARSNGSTVRSSTNKHRITETIPEDEILNGPSEFLVPAVPPKKSKKTKASVASKKNNVEDVAEDATKNKTLKGNSSIVSNPAFNLSTSSPNTDNTLVVENNSAKSNEKTTNRQETLNENPNIDNLLTKIAFVDLCKLPDENFHSSNVQSDSQYSTYTNLPRNTRQETGYGTGTGTGTDISDVQNVPSEALINDNRQSTNSSVMNNISHVPSIKVISNQTEVERKIEQPPNDFTNNTKAEEVKCGVSRSHFKQDLILDVNNPDLIYDIQNGKPVPLQWTMTPPTIDLVEDLTEHYIATNMVDNGSSMSCGYLTVPFNYTKALFSGKSTIFYNVLNGKVTFSVGANKKSGSMGHSFIIPKDFIYTITNPSQSEPATLYFVINEKTSTS